MPEVHIFATLQELELARRRAEKAAEGKRANAAAARAKRRATRPRTDDRGAAAADAEAEEASHEEEDDLEAKLAATRDEKEAKRLRRFVTRRQAQLKRMAAPKACRLQRVGVRAAA